MSDPVAPVSGPPLVYPIQPIKPIVRRDGGDPGVTRSSASTPPPAQTQGAGRLLDISV